MSKQTLEVKHTKKSLEILRNSKSGIKYPSLFYPGDTKPGGWNKPDTGTWVFLFRYLGTLVVSVLGC